MLELAYGKSERGICYSCNGLNPPLMITFIKRQNSSYFPFIWKAAKSNTLIKNICKCGRNKW